MKKIIGLLLVVCSVLLMTGCGIDDGEPGVIEADTGQRIPMISIDADVIRPAPPHGGKDLFRAGMGQMTFADKLKHSCDRTHKNHLFCSL